MHHPPLFAKRVEKQDCLNWLTAPAIVNYEVWLNNSAQWCIQLSSRHTCTHLGIAPRLFTHVSSSLLAVNSGVTRSLSQGGQALLKGAHWPPFGNGIIISQKFTCFTYIWALAFTYSRHIHVGVSLHAHPVPGESHIQPHANREVATRDTRTTQKWLFIAQYKADVTL